MNTRVAATCFSLAAVLPACNSTASPQATSTVSYPPPQCTVYTADAGVADAGASATPHWTACEANLLNGTLTIQLYTQGVNCSADAYPTPNVQLRLNASQAPQKAIAVGGSGQPQPGQAFVTYEISETVQRSPSGVVFVNGNDSDGSGSIQLGAFQVDPSSLTADLDLSAVTFPPATPPIPTLPHVAVTASAGPLCSHSSASAGSSSGGSTSGGSSGGSSGGLTQPDCTSCTSNSQCSGAYCYAGACGETNCPNPNGISCCQPQGGGCQCDAQCCSRSCSIQSGSVGICN